MAHCTLYTSRSRPLCQQVRLVLLATGQSCELRVIDPTRPPEALLEVVARPRLPLLMTAAGEIEMGAEAVVHWALAKTPDSSLWPDNNLCRQAISRLTQAFNGPFATALRGYHIQLAGKGRGIDHRGSLEVFLAQLEGRLAAGGYLVGDNETLADLALLPWVAALARLDTTWFGVASYPQLWVWLTRYRDDVRVRRAFAAPPLWCDGSDPAWLKIARDERAAS